MSFESAANLYYDPPDEPGDNGSGECPVCSHNALEPLGRLGNLMWFRCGCCGMDCSRDIAEEEE